MAPRLPPRGRFTHLTAAEILGWWLPPTPPKLPVFAAVDPDEHRPRRPGLRVRRTAPVAASRAVGGLPLDHPIDVLLDCARDLSLLDLVVLADSALAAQSCTLGELHEAARHRRRGAPLLRKALPLVDSRSESPCESLLRVLHVVCGVEVVPQHVVHDDRGDFVARGDLWLVGTTPLHEYDGGDHLTVRWQRDDLARSRRIGNQTWLRRGYTAGEVLRSPITILRDADSSLGREHRPDRIRPWHRLLAESLFTPSGQARIRDRLDLGWLATEPVTRDSRIGHNAVGSDRLRQGLSAVTDCGRGPERRRQGRRGLTMRVACSPAGPARR